MQGGLSAPNRFAAFRIVLSEAVQKARTESAKRRAPTSPAYAAHKDATTNAERAAAYAAFTRADQAALRADCDAVRATYETARLADIHAAEARRKALYDADLAASKTTEKKRIAALPQKWTP